ncbi:MAG: DNA mismatch repair endonuclease MutH [Gammaproteobacteria bacterium]|nr:DNA mismatch repair endonuclease MutH [Gammaproteobacteria bacterium]
MASAEAELLARANKLAGSTLADVAAATGNPVPLDLRKAKGWIGELLECALGATAGSRPVPDFPELGIEMKTLPVGRNGRARESTFVCTATVRGGHTETWENSPVRAKLNRMLWIPVDADPERPLAQRRLGRPFLWSPCAAEESVLRNDWEEIMDMIAIGELAAISSEMGTWLQLRPKAMHGSARTTTFDENGVPTKTLPRGFYLRAAFTNRLLGHG